MKGGIPRKGLIAHWQNSDVSSQIFVVSTFLSITYNMLIMISVHFQKSKCMRIIIIIEQEQYIIDCFRTARNSKNSVQT